MGVRVLIVDDNAAIRNRLCSMLNELADFDVVGSAPDGASALLGIAAHSPDVVVIDLRLPDVSGLDLIAQVKRAVDAPRVVAMTSQPERFYRKECLDRGADAFVDKAAPFSELITALTTGLSDRR